MNTWKLSIKPNASEGYDPFEFCKNNSLVGVGWAKAYAVKPPVSLEEAKEMVVGRYGKWNSALKALLERMQPNDHVWLHQRGSYYLCRVGAKVLYGADIDKDFIPLDLGHCREAEWVKVPEIFVSGSIQRGTIAQRMTQRIKITPEAYNYHQYLFDELKKDPNWVPAMPDTLFENKVTKLKPTELFAIMSPDDVEDIVSAFLQSMGWVLIKSTCFRSKPVFEFSMRNWNSKTCLVQVKSGKKPNPLAPEDYRQYVSDNHIIYLFSTHPNAYPGEAVDGVRCISQKELINWLKSNAWVLTDSLKLRIWLYMKGNE